MASAGKKKTVKKKSTSKTPGAGVKKTAKQAGSKKTTTSKAASSKKPSVKKMASKKSASTKTRAKTRAKTLAQTKVGKGALQKIDPEHRRRMIAETSYFIAERRGFVSGSPSDDWLEAEVLVDRLLETGEVGNGTPTPSSK